MIKFNIKNHYCIYCRCVCPSIIQVCGPCNNKLIQKIKWADGVFK